MKTPLILLGALTVALALRASEASDTSDKFFIQAAAQLDMLQAHQAEMAIGQAKNDDLRNYAKEMVRDHTAWYEKLSAIATKLWVSIPKGISAGTDNVMIRLTNLKGDEFDLRFARDQVSQYKGEIVIFEHELADGLNQDAKAFAAQALPELRKLLQEAQEWETALSKNRARS